MRLIGILFCVFFSFQLFSQNYITSKNAPEKIKKAFKSAHSAFDVYNYDKSIKELEKIIKKEPLFINAYYLMAECFIQKKNWNEAVKYLNTSIEKAPNYDPGVYYTLGQIYLLQEQYVEARKQLETFLTYPSKNIAKDNRAKKMLADAKFRPDALARPVRFEPKNMGPNINSKFRDYFPSVTADENTLIYTVQIGEGRNAQEDLYRSLKIDGEWSKSEPLPNINTDENEAAQSISADGKFLVFTVCNRPGDYGSCDLYYSERIGGRWTEPKNIGAPINTANWESQPSVAANANAIYFTRGGARGQGNKDLMVSFKNIDGSWQTPQPVTELNTPYDDSAPCIHPDGQTLYFSSSGHEGMGGLDLFVSRLQTNGQWGKPVNLGYPINTAQNEEAVAVSLSGTLAYIASDRPNGFGSLDIYSFEMPENIRPNHVTYVNGFVFDAETKRSLAKTTVEIYDLNKNKLYATVKTDADGEFLLCLPLGKDYSLNVNKQMYLFYSDNFALSEHRKHNDPFILKIPLEQIKVTTSENTNLDNKPIILKNVFFGTNSSELRPESLIELEKLYQLLFDNPKMKIRLNGHTDNEGSDIDNLILSDKRAHAVKNYLISKGIDSARLEAKGYGETQPIADNTSFEGRKQNRRTEFVVIQ